MGDDDKNERLNIALNFTDETRRRIARELRRMAAAEGTEYKPFEDVSAWTRSIWLAAAELIELTPRH